MLVLTIREQRELNAALLLPALAMLGGLFTVCQDQLVQAVINIAGNTASSNYLLNMYLESGATATGRQDLQLDWPDRPVSMKPRTAADDRREARARLRPEAATNVYRGHFISSTVADGKYVYSTNNTRVATIEEAVELIDRIVDSNSNN
jgi:hypothetical protein